jgi:hypothetical protein
VNPGGRHRLTTDWANRDYVVYVNSDGTVTRSKSGEYRVSLGSVAYSVDIGDTFPVGA